MSTLACRLRTTWALGLASIVSVLIYRALIRLEKHPVQKLKAKTPTGPFFRVPSVIDATLPLVDSWNDEGQSFGWYSFKLEGCPPDWHCNPLTGKVIQTPTRPWWNIPDFDLDIGDIKTVWEASRFPWALSLAQQARRGDSNALDRLNAWIADWLIANPPYLGPNWKCGQESSLRLLHLAASAVVLDQVEKSEAGLLDLVSLSLKRIAPTRSYAVAQNNNHGTSEAAALFVGGSWLVANGRSEGAKWEQQGRRLLEERVARLIDKDGTFSQYSIVYHRLMLDTLSFAEIWCRRLNRELFSQRFHKRMALATRWLMAFVDPDTGDAPNIGANDGAHILNFAQASYRDFRPSAGLASLLFLEESAYGVVGTATAQWLNLDPPETRNVLPASTVFDAGGFAVLRQGRAMAVLRYPRFRFRPSQSDALHLDLFVDGVNHLRDAGSYSYNLGEEWTRYFSGTEGHNTIMFDNRDQMPRLSRFLFGDWLITDTVTPMNDTVTETSFSAKYTDSQSASHRRDVVLSANSLHVTDTVSGFKNNAVLRWRLAPGNWHLDGHAVHNGNARLSISADVPVLRIELKEGWESLYYHAKSRLPVLEVEIGRPGTLQSIYKWVL